MLDEAAGSFRVVPVTNAGPVKTAAGSFCRPFQRCPCWLQVPLAEGPCSIVDNENRGTDNKR